MFRFHLPMKITDDEYLSLGLASRWIYEEIYGPDSLGSFRKQKTACDTGKAFQDCPFPVMTLTVSTLPSMAMTVTLSEKCLRIYHESSYVHLIFRLR